MSKTEPKYNRNDKVEFALKDASSKSGYSHKCGYIKRSTMKRRLLRKDVVTYDICEANREERYLWCDIPECNIYGIVEAKTYHKDKPLSVKGHKTYKDFGEMKELINNNE